MQGGFRMNNQYDNVGAQSGRRAFTLMELLVTVSIIGVLVALIVPMAQRSIDSGKTTKSVSAMKNLLSCASQTQAEYGGSYYRKISSPNGRLYFVQFYVTEYCETNTNALRSPFDETFDERAKSSTLKYAPTDKKVAWSYSMNLSLPLAVPNSAEPSIYYPNHLRMQSYSRAALFIESMGTIGGFGRDANLDSLVRYPYRDGTHTLVGFFDGHVDFVSKVNLKGGSDSTWTTEDKNLFWTGSP